MTSKAVSAIERTLDSKNQRIAAPVAIKIAEATGILRKCIEVPEPERDRERDRDAAMGQMIRMATTKAVRYSDPLPDSLIEQLRWIQGYSKEVLEACDQNRKQAGGSRAALASTEGRES